MSVRSAACSTRSLPAEARHGPHPREARRNGSASTLNGQRALFENLLLPERVADYPEFRYMGSKHRLLAWIHSVLRTLDFETAADPFVGSGCVAYLIKAMGKRVRASDFLKFPTVIASATVGNSHRELRSSVVEQLLHPVKNGPDFIAKTFEGIFFTPADLRFLDRVSANLADLDHPHQRDLAMAALIRSCLKKQPRGVFTVSGDLSHYDDGRRDLRLSVEEHFLEQVEAFNAIVFDNGHRNTVRQADVFSLRPRGVDLVYLDPPYVPRSDDNCYIKRYHFLEGLSCYWRGLRIMPETKVQKVEKPSHHSAIAARRSKLLTGCSVSTARARLCSPIPRTAFRIDPNSKSCSAGTSGT